MMLLSNKNKDFIVLCPNGRRVTVKRNLSASIGQIIEDACVKQGFDPLKYNLKHLRRVLDPSSTIQYANIPNHAQLELIEASHRREEQLVTINLVTDTGQRMMTDFPSNASLWDVLTHHSHNPENNFTLPNEYDTLEPFIVYTMRKIAGNELKTTTLKSLGLYSGKCMMRYNVQTKLAVPSEVSQIVIVKPTPEISTKIIEENVPDSAKSTTEVEIPEPLEQPGFELCAEKLTSEENLTIETPGPTSFSTPASTLFQNQAATSSSVPTAAFVSTSFPIQNFDSATSAPVLTSQQASPTPIETIVKMNVTTDGKESLKLYDDGLECMKVHEKNQSAEELPNSNTRISLSDHDWTLFSLDDAPPSELTEEGDTFFDLTVDEIRKLYMERVNQLKELEEKPLMTQQLRDLEKDSRLLTAMNRYPVTQLRICFADRHVIQANFKPRSTIREVMDFIRPLLKKKNMDFYFYTTFPRLVLDPDATLVEAGCIPKARLYFGHDIQEEKDVLSELTLSKKSSFEGATRAVIKARNVSAPSDHTFITPGSSQGTVPAVCGQPNDYSNSRPIHSPPKQKPKWFKLGK